MKRFIWFFVAVFALSFGAVKAEETAGADPEWKHLLGLSYNFNTRARFDDVMMVIGSSVYSAEVEFEAENGAGIIYEARRAAKNDWGYALGAEYVFTRRFERTTVTIDNYTGSGDVDDDDGFSTLAGYANLIYQWESFYIPFGINYTSIDYKGDGDLDAGFGVNLGLGLQFTEKVYGEFMIKSSNTAFDEDDDSLDFGDGTLTFAAIQLKYNFF